ncbi:MAG TPA: cupin domain-containing protein [Mycobacteriales bacterium]|nr:cupin domain-containing protein [Mycobacteriales bacterium]
MPEVLRISAHESLRIVRDEASGLEVEATYEPGGAAPPAHLHPAQDEHFQVVAGTLHVELDGATHDLGAGDSIAIPRGSTHRMWNTGSEPARALWRTEPALRTAGWFRGLAALQEAAERRGRHRADLLAFAVHARRHRDTFRLVTPFPGTGALVGILAAAGRLSGRQRLLQ